MPRLILHLGIHKTGSSAIQSALARNVGALRKQRMIYPDFPSLPAARAGKVSSGNGLPLAKLLGSSTPYAQPVSCDRIHTELEDAYSKGCDLLYSSEALLLIESEKAAEFFEFAETIGFATKLVLYVRSVADLAVSTYHQEVKQKRMTGSFSDFLSSFDAEPLRSALALCRAFGHDRMLVRNYDAHRGDLIEDFFRHMLGFWPLDGFFLDHLLVNPSLSEAELAIMRTMNSVLTDPRHSRIAAEALMTANRTVNHACTISHEDYQAIETRFSSLVTDINAFVQDVPITLKSNALVIGETAELRLSEIEAALARLSANIIELVGAMRRPKRLH
jgi:hypothetical protein